MIGLTISLNTRPLQGALGYIGENVGNRCIALALNLALDKVYTVAKREVAKTANISITDIASTMRKIKAGPGSLTAILRVRDSWRSAGYPQFKASQDDVGSSFSPWKDQRESIPHGFIATMRSGHESIFKRVGKSRLPIHDVGWGPNVAREVVREDHGHNIPTLIRTTAGEVFYPEFARQYERVVAEAKAKFGV